MGLTTAATNAALDAAVPNGFIGVATDYPGDAGSTEVTGGSPAYARLAASWNAASSKTKSLAAAVTGFNIPAGIVAKWFVAWSLVTGGVAKALAPVGSTKRGIGDCNATGSVITSRAHGLADSTVPNGVRVVFFPAEGAAMPTNIVEGTDYYIVNKTTDTWQIAATIGGTAIAIGSGQVRWQDMIPATDPAQFTVDCNAFTIYG
jgi:hypothetical protein